MNRSCLSTPRDGGHQCYKGLFVHEKLLMANYGCPKFINHAEPSVESKAFCWCGLASSFTHRFLSTLKHSNESLPPQLADGREEERGQLAVENKFLIQEGKLWNETSGDDSDDEDDDLVEDTQGVEVYKEDTELRPLLFARAVSGADAVDAVDAADATYECSRRRRRRGTPQTPMDCACRNKKDGKKLKHHGRNGVNAITKACAQSCNDAAVDSGKDGCTIPEGSACFMSKISVRPICAHCFGQQIDCSDQYCLEQCACASSSKACKDCNDAHCSAQFHHCSGIDPDGQGGRRRRRPHKSAALGAESQNVLPLSTNGSEYLLLV